MPASLSPEFREQLAAAVEARRGARNGAEITFTCPNPSHEDKHPSARYNVKKTAWTCDVCATGGGALDLAKLLGIQIPARAGLTLAEFAAAKRLDLDFLHSIGVRDGRNFGDPCVMFPYADAGGTVRAERRRLSLTGPSRFTWRKGDRVLPYGLPGLTEARTIGYVHIVEGESDALTLWHKGIPALGIPGASTWRSEFVSIVTHISVVYLWREPDAGGDALTAKIVRDIPEVHIIEAPVKDASALWLKLDGDAEKFGAAVRDLMERARPAATIRAETLTREARELWARCESLARDPDLLGEIEKAITAGGYAGDPTAPLLTYMGIVSRFQPRPMNLHVLAASATGKSKAVDAAKELHPASAFHEIGAGSARALVYDDDADYRHRTVIVAEADSIPEDGPAASAIRALAADNCMRYAVVERDEDTGRFHTRHIAKPGPTGLITTSTRSMGEQMSTRMLVVSVSDSPDQTRQIMRAQAEGATGQGGRAVDVSALHALQSWLEIAGDRAVVIPFALRLAELVPDSLVRVRRDFPQLLSMIGAMATLYQCQRMRDSHGRIIADLDDYANARRLLLDVFTETVTGGVSQAVRETVTAVRELTAGQTVEMPALAKYLELHRATAWRRVKQAIRLGFLVNEETRRGQPARLRLGDALPDDQPALPTIEQLGGDTYHADDNATVQPNSSDAIGVARLHANGSDIYPPTGEQLNGHKPGHLVKAALGLSAELGAKD